MSGHLVMSEKERIRKTMFDEVKAGRLTLIKASERLELSYRHVIRSYGRFAAQGDAGLVHRNRGRPSNRATVAKDKAAVLKRYAQRYEGFGPTLAAEKLAVDGYKVDHETLRRWLIADGQWSRRRKRKGYRIRRERKAHFGQLVQMDGSHHQWLGTEGPQCCLMNMVDDATGHTLSLMADQETTAAAMELLWAWCELYGIPQTLYTDKKSVFVTTREPTIEEQLAGEEPQTAFGKACAKLGIEIIPAHSPQAKGRVERNHGVYQDRFVKELALRRITTIDGANKALRNGFIDMLNAKFEKAPTAQPDFHRPLASSINLADVFCIEDYRIVQNDWTVRYENDHYQILEDNRPLPRPKDKIVIRTRLDGSVHLLYHDRPLQYRKLTRAQLTQKTGLKAKSAHTFKDHP